jgi:hypothetical protein
MDEQMDKELEPITIAVPVLARIRRFCYGYFLGPCYMYYAKALNIEESGSTPDEAAQRLATKIRKSLENGNG